MDRPAVPQIIEAEGNPTDIGRTIGRAVGDRLHAFRALILDDAHQRLGAALSPGRLQALADAHLLAQERYAPALVAELRALADAAEVPFAEVFFLNCFRELSGLWSAETSAALLADHGGCTSFATTAPATLDGGTYLGQNYDLRAYYERHTVLLRLKPADAPEMLVYTFPGVLAGAGLNAAGVGVCINWLPCNDARPGVAFAFLVRQILRQPRLGAAIQQILVAERAQGANFLLCGAGGMILSAITSATEARVVAPTNGLFAHTNHYEHEGLQHRNAVRLDEGVGGTRVRYHRIWQLLRANHGQITPAMLHGFAADHADYPSGICSHGDPVKSECACGKTVGSILLDPARGAMHVAIGNPCAASFVPYHLSSVAAATAM